MTLEYISHSCFVIEIKGKRLVFDPWITPSAYSEQWHLFPKPLDIEPAINSDIVLFSHGHNDHFNADSLKLIQKDAHVFFPFQWREGVVNYLNHLGFETITEAVNFRTYSLDDIQITYLGYSLESVIVVECEGYVIVNINDALNSNHETAANFLLEKIKAKWGKIDFLLSGWSGAGYFPNKVHYEGKDDHEIALVREQYFANNFCRFTQYLKPDIAIAFAPGFVLLQNDNRWINEIKFPREIVGSYFKEHFDKTTAIQFPLMYPGDYYEGKNLVLRSAYHQHSSEKEMYKNLEDEFKEEIAFANRVEIIGNDEINQLEEKLAYWLDRNKSLYSDEVIADSVFSVELTDTKKPAFFNIRFVNSKAELIVNSEANPDDRLLIKVRGKLLLQNLEKEWGGDLLSIGYAIEVYIYAELSLEKNLDIVCVRLISRFPRLKDDYAKNAGRMMKYYLQNPSIANLWIKQKIKLRPYVNKYPFNERDHWITYKKCDLCKVCNMPELDFSDLKSPIQSNAGEQF